MNYNKLVRLILKKAIEGRGGFKNPNFPLVTPPVAVDEREKLGVWTQNTGKSSRESASIDRYRQWTQSIRNGSEAIVFGSASHYDLAMFWLQRGGRKTGPKN